MFRTKPDVPDERYRAAYEQHEQQARVATGKAGAALVALLMPFGVTLDLAIYPEQTPFFLMLRLVCAALAGGIWFLLTRPFGQKHHAILGLLTVLLPASFITWMIVDREGPTSPYYAGLNLILLAVSLVARWDSRESALAVGGVFLMYLAACVLHGPVGQLGGLFLGYCIFMVETGVIVVVGNHFFNRLRFREFVSRCELNERKRELEEAIQKLREAELQLVQQEKMASLGVMSAGIIHEINNPLNYATTGLYTLRQKGKYLVAEQQADFEDVLKDVEEGVSRVKTIVSDLRTFSHPETESRDQIEVAGVVESALRFLSGEWKHKVTIEKDLTPHQTIYTNQNKIVHVVLNLLQNSLDALNGKQFQDESPTIWIEGRIENGLSRLIIRDNGTGIETQNLDKIFDPFFTTKDVGQGMGLGLSICYRIVQDYDGRIAVRTEPGKFCEFTLEFPVKG